MTSFRVALAYSYLNKYLTVIIYFITTVTLARLLTPADIGVYTVAAVFVGLGHLLREFGINEYIVQEKELTPDRIRAAFTLNMLFGWSIALILFFARTPIGNFYNSEGVREVIGLLCINFLLVPIGAITFAHIRREMRFQHLMVIQVASAITSSLVGILSALAGEAYRSLVWSAIAGTATSVLLTFVFRSKEMLLLPGIREIPHVFAFCRYAGSRQLITHAGQTSPDWILGKLLDMSAVGLYSRGLGTISIFNKAFLEALWGVILPHFSRQLRDGALDKDQYLFLVECVTAVAWPFFATLAVLSEPVIRLLFGDQWLESAPVLRVLCLGAVLVYTNVLMDQMLISAGHIRLSFRIIVILQVLTVAAVFLSAPNGLIWVAGAIMAVNFIQLCTYQLVGQRIFEISFQAFARIYIRNALLTCVSVISPLVAALTLDDVQLVFLPYLSAVIAATVLAWTAGIWLLKSSLFAEMIKALTYVKALRRPRASSGSSG